MKPKKDNTSTSKESKITELVDFLKELSQSEESMNNKMIIAGLKLYKLWEQREKDLRDSKIGLEAYQMGMLDTDYDKNQTDEKNNEDDDDDEDYGELLDDELINILRQQDVHELDQKEYLSFGVLWAIIDFIYS